MDRLEKLLSMVRESSNTVVFTGAGVSTLSGIPDFRGPHGVYNSPWKGLDVETILSIDFFHENPEIFFAWAKDVWYRLEDYEPTIVHTTLAKMERMGLVQGVFTQNIDMLHTRAGSKKVYEVHGSSRHQYCTNCHRHYSYEEIAKIVTNDEIPHCTQCGAIIKPDIVFYGECLDESILRRAYTMFSQCDLAIVCGSSLTVQPAASFPVYALQNHRKLIIINGSETMLDTYADLKLDDLEESFRYLDEHLIEE